MFHSTDARRACRRGAIGSTMSTYPRDTGSNPVEGNGHFFPSYRQLYLSSFFDTNLRLCHKATACFFFVSRYTRSLIFPNSRKKKHTRKKHQMQRSVQPCFCARGVFVFPLPLVACRNCGRPGPLPC